METTMMAIMTAMATPMIIRIWVETYWVDDTEHEGNHITFISFHLHELKEPKLEVCLIRGTHIRNLPHILWNLFSSSIRRNKNSSDIPSGPDSHYVWSLARKRQDCLGMNKNLRPIQYMISPSQRERPNRDSNARVGEIVWKIPTCLVLKGIKSLLTFYNFGDIVSHDGDCVIDLCLNGSSLGIWPRASTGSRGIGWRATAGEVRIIRFRPGRQ